MLIQHKAKNSRWMEKIKQPTGVLSSYKFDNIDTTAWLCKSKIKNQKNGDQMIESPHLYRISFQGHYNGRQDARGSQIFQRGEICIYADKVTDYTLAV